MKKCNRCQETKSFDMFLKHSYSPDGYYSICKPCRAETAAKYRARPEVIAREKERLAKAYKDRKEELSVRRKQRYAENKEKELLRNKAWRDKNLEKSREICRQWARNNPSVMRSLVIKRRAMKLNAEGSYKEKDIVDMYSKQDGKCVYCNAEFNDKFQIDHIIPLSRGGTNWPSNLQLLCEPCNKSKGNKLPEEFEAYRNAKQSVPGKVDKLVA